MGAINVKHTGSGAAIALSSDGTSLLLDGTAVGGGGGSPDLFAESYNGSSTLPSAAGTNSVSIGVNADVAAAATGGFAAGFNADVNNQYAIAGPHARGWGNYGVAFGYEAQASANHAVSIGATSGANGARNTGAGAVVLGGSHASGADSFAAAIDNNSASYGALSANSIAMGDRSKSSAERGIAIGGYGALASGVSSLAFGYQAEANQTYASGFGYASKAYGSYSFAGTQSHASGSKSVALGIGDTTTTYGAQHLSGIAIGFQATTTADKQIALGSSTAQVKVSGAYTLPTADGTANQVLTTDGAGAVTFATAAGGSPDLFAENYTTGTKPATTGTNAVAIGKGSSAAGTEAIAMVDGTADSQDSFAVGGTVQSAIGGYAIGKSAQVYSQYGLALGKSSLVTTATDGTAIGANAVAAGNTAVATAKSRASGVDSFAAAIGNNTSSYGASGDHSVAMGLLSKSSDHGSVAIGKNCISDGGRTVALGHQTTASEFYSFAVGALSEALQTGSVCTGIRGRSDVQGKRVHSSSTFSAQIGNCQTGELVLGKQTTDATPIQLTSLPGNSASATNSITLPNNSCYGFTGTVIARENSAQTNDFAVWEIKGGAVRAASAATTALGSYNINKISESTGAATWSIALSADTTNGAVAITVTGEASHSIRWVATVNTTEVTY